jgi:hypothetical protein
MGKLLGFPYSSLVEVCIHIRQTPAASVKLLLHPPRNVFIVLDLLYNLFGLLITITGTLQELVMPISRLMRSLRVPHPTLATYAVKPLRVVSTPRVVSRPEVSRPHPFAG